MLGSVFGDIAGSVYEFDNIHTTDFELLGKGTTFTDDSILTIAVADWLMMGVLTEDRLVYLIQQYVERYPHPMGGYGMRFSQWARQVHPQPYGSWGNGSAMRVAPVGWAFDSLEQTEEIAALTARITHNHPEGIKGAQATAAAIYMARNLATKAEIKQYIETRYGYNLSRTCDEIRPTYTFNESCQDTVPQAIVAFLDSVDFESAIRLAVSLGGDSDTLACITGGIAEAFYGMCNSIPEHRDAPFEKRFFQDEAKDRLTPDLREVVEQFYDRIAARNKRFMGKNECATVKLEVPWTIHEHDERVLDETGYQSFLKSYQPDYDMRFGVYYENGWNYIYRSHFLLEKFRFESTDGKRYQLTDWLTSGYSELDLIDEVLHYGYFAKPFYNKNRVHKNL